MTIASLVNQLIGLINLAVPIIIGLTLVAFIWRAVMTIGKVGQDNVKTREQYHTFFLWGLGAIFIMVSLWGILNILSGIFFNTGTSPTDSAINQYNPQNYPCTQVGGSSGCN